MDTIIKESINENWNTRLQNYNVGTIHQTKEYVEYIKKSRNSSSYYITFEINNKIVGQLSLHKFPGIKRKFESYGINPSFKFLNVFNNFKPVFTWEYGPIIFDEKHKTEIYYEISKLKKFFQGPIKGILPPLLEPSHELVNNGWQEKKIGTFLIDLTKSEEELWNNIDKQSGRKAIRRSQNKNVVIKPIKNLQDLKIHHSLLNEGKKMANIGKYPFSNLQYFWTMLENVGRFGFIAWQNEIPLASTLVTTYNGYINEWGFADSKFNRENLLNATDLIKWHIIKWGHESGYRIFDLSGVNPNATSGKEKGIFNFKKKWGGQLYDLYQYSFL